MNQNRNILIFTDSRGYIKSKETNHKVYSEQLIEMGKYNITAYLCPCKWTTTLDFLEMYELGIINLEKYDVIILHTGIVEHSPRHQKIAINFLYHNEKKQLIKNVQPSINYKSRLENEKKAIFDKIFDEKNILAHLNNPFEIIYEDDKTINMYSLEMATKYLIPRLKKIKSLIWISSNDIVENWNGDYFKERPKNINLIEDYSKLFCKELSNVINLHVWNEKEIKKYTSDNMHLTKEGNDYIYQKLIEKINELNI